MDEIECKKCSWIGKDDDLDSVMEKGAPFPIDLCPNCGSWQHLSYIKKKNAKENHNGV